MALEFWFEFASTYSYPAACRIQELARASQVRLEYRPFLLGPIFRSQGWQDSPFNLYPAKGRYMWRDLERLCAQYQIPWRRPEIFPQNGLNAARLASAAQEEAWVGDFVKEVYRANFALGQNIAEIPVLAGILERLGQNPPHWLELAQSSEVKERLRAQTEEAQRRGIFGSPTYFVGDEMFWGQDRLETALTWARSRY